MTFFFKKKYNFKERAVKFLKRFLFKKRADKLVKIEIFKKVLTNFS